MTLTYRSTAGRRLTVTEGDGNIAHLAAADGITFVQSGTGAIAEPSQTALRRLKFLGQYDTTANFNTARAAHTGTMGAPPTTQFANVDPTATTPFALISGGGTFSGTYDPVFYIGYNIGGQNGNTKITSAEPMMKLGFEANFDNATDNLMEWNLDYTSDDGLVTRRPIYVTIGRDGPAKNSVGFEFTYGGSTFSISHTDTTTPFQLNDDKDATFTVASFTVSASDSLGIFLDSDTHRFRNKTATRYRTDFQVGASGLAITVFDDTGGVYLPVSINSVQTITLGANAAPGIKFSPSSGATKNMELIQSGDTFYFQKAGVGGKAAVDIETGVISAAIGTAIPAGGTAGVGYKFSSTSNFGVFFGSGAPSLAAAKGSLYLRSDGSGTTDRAYINTDGSTTWTALTTAA